MKKATRVAIEAVLVVVISGLGRSTPGVMGKVLLVLGLMVLVYAIVDLLRKEKQPPTV